MSHSSMRRMLRVDLSKATISEETPTDWIKTLLVPGSRAVDEVALSPLWLMVGRCRRGQ